MPKNNNFMKGENIMGGLLTGGTDVATAITTITTGAKGMLDILTSAPCVYFVALGLAAGCAALVKKFSNRG